MLVQLAIRDIVLIDRLDLAFATGLTVLTGETGAGKSILLDAFSLALGGRGDGGLVRHGQPQGQVTAVFDLAAGHAARAVLRANDIADDGDLILRRVQMADGRTRAFVNDQPVSVQVLRATGAALVEIHGQHDDRALTDAASHRALLDAFGGLEGLAADVAGRHGAWRRATQTLAQHRARMEKARAEGDWLRHAVEELSKLAVRPGEELVLAERRTGMMQAEKIAVDLKEAHEGVAGSASPTPGLASVIRRLERRGAQVPRLVEPAIAALDQALNALEEARIALETALGEANFDPAELERVEERLFALRAAARKFDVAVDGLPVLAQRYAGELAALDEGEGHLSALETAERAARQSYEAAAQELSARRHAAAQALDAAVNAELPPLKLDRARFTTQLQSDKAFAAPEGFDRAEFWVQTNPGTRPGPMMKVASGGELSRFMLALKVALADRGSAPTLVFDEIDSGVGGAVADAIGLRLARLAERVQVVNVTHAPQVAARAASHFLISKEAQAAGEAERVATRVVALDAPRRREEIARMLAGAHVTDEARAAADRLLQAR
ncbi:DNA repair protein RecN [Labrys wisconsinensis]|uniref:DNA repair protein RecN n=1 Tax=Labrys wisconsinensis TaxID=425677 RepID=A0ABU0JBH5_9HYPH|nr:DNA repair protein RecN [Labrys wisconsinensis]MDQ0471624.1 DNA repair protein RecN (Recombination protein N) [Labrys wisconsinensis]